MSWRPKEGWKNPHTPMQKDEFVNLIDAHFRQLADAKHIAFENGADAILEALKKTAARVENGQFIRDGWLAFIEDDK